MEPASMSLEEGDVPRGRKHVQPASAGQLAEEMAMFQTRHRVIDQSTGKPAAERASGRVEEEVPRGRAHGKEGDRNGVPSMTAGDKLYSAVQFSPEYLANMNPARSRLGVEKPASRADIQNTWAIKDQAQRYDRDVAEVRALPKYPKGE
jgi:hypothetical protein